MGSSEFSSSQLLSHSLFASDLAYLQEELDWIEIRARRLMMVHKVESIEGRKDDDDSEYYEEEPLDEYQEKIQVDFEREQKLRRDIDARLAVHLDQGKPVALDRICALYDLDPFERTVLLLAAAPCFSRTFDSMLGKLEKADYYSHDLNVEVIFNFCRLSFSERIQHRNYFSPTSTLLANDLVSISMDRRYSSPRDLLNATIQITHRTLAFLLGDNELDDSFIEFSSVEDPKVVLEQVVLEEDSKRRILSVVEHHERYLGYRKEWGFDEVIRYGRGILMLFHGVPGTGKTMMAHAIARHMDKRILNVDIPTFLQHHDTERFLPGLFREARLQNAILFFDECEALFGSRQYGNHAMTVLLTELERFEGVAILATNLPEVLDPALDRRILVKVRFPEPDREARLAIWEKHIPAQAPIAEDVDLGALAERFEMTGGYIKNAVLMAVASAVHDGADEPVIRMAHFLQAAQEQIKYSPEADTRLLQPKALLSDLVLSSETDEGVRMVLSSFRHRRVVFDRWSVGKHQLAGKGISALLVGPEGTGKTLSAEAIAHELNRPLLLKLCASMVSGNVGDTEHQLISAFEQAATNDAVLLFEDLDLLFMPVVSDNSDSRLLLLARCFEQLLGRHAGLVLATSRNLADIPASIKLAFQQHVAFSLPTTEEQLALWNKYLPDTVPKESGLSLESICQAYPCNGRTIQRVALDGALRAVECGQLTLSMIRAKLSE